MRTNILSKLNWKAHCAWAHETQTQYYLGAHKAISLLIPLLQGTLWIMWNMCSSYLSWFSGWHAQLVYFWVLVEILLSGEERGKFGSKCEKGGVDRCPYKKVGWLYKTLKKQPSKEKTAKIKYGAWVNYVIFHPQWPLDRVIVGKLLASKNEPLNWSFVPVGAFLPTSGKGEKENLGLMKEGKICCKVPKKAK